MKASGKGVDNRFQDLSGTKFGHLVVIKKISGGRRTTGGIRKRSRTKYLCHCACGRELEVWAANLSSGHSTSCGCQTKYKRGYVDLTGRVFGSLEVIRQSEAMSKYRGVLWICKCSCGKEVEITSNGLTSGNNKTCGDRRVHYRSPRVGELPINHINYIRNNAIKRNLPFNLEPQYLWDLFLKQNRKCALSGEPLVFTQAHYAEGKHPETTASLDRIDNNEGYVAGNVRWVHKDINKMRLTHNDSDFIRWCRKVVEYSETGGKIPGWHDWFFMIVDVIKLRSPDLNTKVGCVVVGSKNNILSTGYNGMPYGIEATPDRLERPAKYLWTEHGDRNCLYHAARLGIPLHGSRMYLTGLPCVDCARGIIQAGLVEIIIDHENQEQWAKTTPKYGPDFERVESMLKEAGVKVTRWVRSTHQEWVRPE